jgi:hypothetical protein
LHSSKDKDQQQNVGCSRCLNNLRDSLLSYKNLQKRLKTPEIDNPELIKVGLRVE